jgi:asparagine synthetase B (glutamine-hydrolysing)
MKPDIRRVLLEWAYAINHHECAVLLSGGVDSAAVCFALQEVGKTVVAYTFTLDDRESSDFLAAKQVARVLRCAWVPVRLPTSIKALQEDMIRLRDLGAKSKTDFECSWPMIYAYHAAAQTVVCSGMGADGHFCISKKGMIHYRDRIDEFRMKLYGSRTYAQQHLHRALANEHQKVAELPFLLEKMKAEFIGTTWDQLNKPKQKQALLDAFQTEFKNIRVRPHTNLQLGDSGISAHIAKLLRSEWNYRGHRSVVGIFNQLVARAL